MSGKAGFMQVVDACVNNKPKIVKQYSTDGRSISIYGNKIFRMLDETTAQISMAGHNTKTTTACINIILGTYIGVGAKIYTDKKTGEYHYTGGPDSIIGDRIINFGEYFTGWFSITINGVKNEERNRTH